MSLSVVATITTKAEFRGEVRQALIAILAPSRAEPGCLQYDLHTDRNDPDRLVMIERWQDDAALDRHLVTPHFAALGAALDGKVTGVDITRLDPVI